MPINASVRNVVLAAMLLFGLGFSFNSVAQDPVTFEVETVQGVIGQSVSFDWTYIGNNDARSIDARINFSDPSLIESIDFSECTDEFDGVADLTTCTDQGNTGDNIFLSFQRQAAPLPSGSGTITVELSASVQEGEVILLEYDPDSFVIENDPDVNFTNGAIEVTDVSAILDVNPDAIDFGGQQTGTTSPPQPISISNEGVDNVGLEVTDITISGANAGDFSLQGGGSCPGVLPFILEDGESCDQFVSFSPSADGVREATLTVDSDADETLNAAVVLSGLGTPPPVDLSFVVSPAYGVAGGPLFGNVIVHVLDTNGDLFTGDSSTVVELGLETDPTGGAVLSGTTSVQVNNGVAVFNDLSINNVGVGFALSADDQNSALNSDASEAFNVVPDQLLQDRFESSN